MTMETVRAAFVTRPGGFARDFATADGERVMVAVATRQQSADLVRTAHRPFWI
jgi:hypothetical protein